MNKTTKTAQFTPGPWVVTEHSSGMICVAGPDHKDLCAVGYNRTEGRNDVANATLIAAAPAMYEALQIMVRVANVDEIDPLVMFASIERARHVLKLAEGKSA